MTGVSGQGRYRLSIRTLMIVIALCALLLAAVVWTYRGFEAVVRERRLAELARIQAEQATAVAAAATAKLEQQRYLAQISSARAVFSDAKTGADDPPKPKIWSRAADQQGSLWGALSVNHAVFKQGQTKDLRIEFTLVNDGDKAIDPKIAESRIVINGKEVVDPGLILGSDHKDVRFNALPPGDHLQFGLVLGDRFKEPGIYRVSWKGTGFQSPEIMLRILPETAR